MLEAWKRPREFHSAEEIDEAIVTLERRVTDAEKLNVPDSYYSNPNNEKLLLHRVRKAIGQIFGEGSPEFAANKDLSFGIDPILSGLPDDEVVAVKERGRDQVVVVLKDLIANLEARKKALS